MGPSTQAEGITQTKQREAEPLAHVRGYNGSLCGRKAAAKFGGIPEICLLSCAKLQIILSFLREVTPPQIPGIEKHKQISRLLLRLFSPFS